MELPIVPELPAPSLVKHAVLPVCVEVCAALFVWVEFKASFTVPLALLLVKLPDEDEETDPGFVCVFVNSPGTPTAPVPDMVEVPALPVEAACAPEALEALPPS